MVRNAANFCSLPPATATARGRLLKAGYHSQASHSGAALKLNIMIAIITYYDRYTVIRLCSMIESDTGYHAPMFAFGRVLEISAVDLGVINKRGFTPVATS